MKIFPRVILLLLVALPSVGQVQVQDSFFGMLVNKMDSFPLKVPVGSIRLWDTGTNWWQLCPTQNHCDWEHLDKWLAIIKSDGIPEVMYTFGKTPDSISSNPTGKCWEARVGLCYPPRDLNSDGGGSDAAFKSFVQAIVEHNQHLDHNRFARIKWWGIWNEPNAKNFWAGTDAQMVRMTKDAREIIKAADSDALILSPEPSALTKHGNFNDAGDWLDGYLSAGGGQYIDVVTFHCYANTNGPNDHPKAEDVLKMVSHVKEKLAKHPEVSGKPMWMTEGSWGKTNEANWGEPDPAMAYVAQYYILLASTGVERVYWYRYDGEQDGCCGTLWTHENGELAGAKAYKEMHKWLVGRTVSHCAPQGHLWSCNLDGPGYKGKIVWDDEYDKSGNVDATSSGAYRDLSGATGPLHQKTVTVGNKPVLLETGSGG